MHKQRPPNLQWNRWGLIHQTSFFLSVANSIVRNFRPKNPESEIAAKNFANVGEKRGENLAKFLADFRPSISKKSGRKKFHEKSSTNSTSHETKFFHCKTLGAWGHKKLSCYLAAPYKRLCYKIFCSGGGGPGGGVQALGRITLFISIAA